MKIILNQNYVNKKARIEKLNEEINELDKKLLTPARTVEDIVRHMELVKERNSLI